MDIHASYPVKFHGGPQLQLLMNAFNLFNRQAAIELDQRYNLVQDDICAGIPDGLCNGDGGLSHTRTRSHRSRSSAIHARPRRIRIS